MKLRAKLFVMSLTIGLLPFAAVGITALLQIHTALSRQAFSQLESLREVKTTEIENYFSSRREDMRLLVDTVAVLRRNAAESLKSIQENKRAQLQNYFKINYDNISVQAENELISQALEQYDGAFKTEGKAEGMAWNSINETMGPALQKIGQQYGYYDLMLIAKDGAIVYSNTKNKDLGANVLTGELKNTHLNKAFQTGLKQVYLEDFANYAPAKQPIAFFTAPVARFGEISGVLVLAITKSTINSIAQRRSSIGNTAETYLVGRIQDKSYYRSDRIIRSGSFGEEIQSAEANKGLAGERGVALMVSVEGVPMLTTYAPLEAAGVNWAIISTMTMEEAITPRLANDTDTDFFTRYITQGNYYDLMLIHPNGKVFYSVRHESDYGSNLFTGKYAKTHLAQVFNQVLKEQELVLSDYALYGPSKNMPAAFIAEPLQVGDQVELVVVLQLLDNSLNAVMQQRAGLGKTGETYLVGSDFTMRSSSHLDPAHRTVQASLQNPKEGKVDTVSSRAALEGNIGQLIGTNYLGQAVLSAYAPVQMGSQQWALIAEISADEAFTTLHHLEKLLGFAALGIIFLLWWSANRFTNHLVVPLLQVNQHLKALSRGRVLEDSLDYQGRDEIAEIVYSTEQLKTGIRNTINQANAIATGDYNSEVVLLSEQDQMGKALSDMTRTLRGVIVQANAIAAGDYSREVRLLSEDDQLGHALSEMTRTLREITARNEEARQQLEQENIQKSLQDWLKTGQTKLNEQMSGEQELAALGKQIITFLASYLNAQVGTFYVLEEANVHHEQPYLKLIASYAYKKRKSLSHEFEIGENLIGQAALERETLVITQVPQDYMTIQSSLGEAVPQNLVIAPFLYEETLKGVVELGSFKAFTETQLHFVEQVAAAIGVAVNTAESRVRLQELLHQSQTQAEELQSQAEELQSQQEELRQTNEELEERGSALERQQDAVRAKNTELERSQAAIQKKAEELELASKYKSEFLANMSHELRTPLNSMLILAQMLSANKDKNLSDKQVEFANTIHKAGSELLHLINDILDLSKVEAGRLELHCEDYPLSSLTEALGEKFNHMAENKGLTFKTQIAPALQGTTLYTDPQRLQQVAINLLSNAFKFTDSGGHVILSIDRPTADTDLSRSHLSVATTLAISVTDTGIGIPESKQKIIFEAFHQADGTTSRRYGGTGLGLSISRELIHLLGGEMQLRSEEGKGSTFTLYVPEHLNPAAVEAPTPRQAAPARPAKPPAVHAALATTTITETPTSHPESAPPAVSGADTVMVQDDRASLQVGERSLLIIEDDAQFAQLLCELTHEKNFKCLIAGDGKVGLEFADRYQPSAIMLDIGLPLVDGWTVMERLKDNPKTRHIPVHFMSGSDESHDARQMGAIGYLMKPVSMAQLGDAFKNIEGFISRTVKDLLLVMAPGERCDKLVELVGGGDVKIARADSLDAAQMAMQDTVFDCLILDVSVEQDNGLRLLEQLRKQDRVNSLPVVIYAERDLTAEEEQILAQSSRNLTVKAVYSPERLLDEATLFLHQIEAHLPKEQQSMLKMMHDKEKILAGKKVLLADDDSRNVFALGSVLEERGMEVFIARDGEHSLAVLDEHPDMNLVLMDIMMPKLDGYEAMQRIRAQPRFRKLPIIALTAKAMKGDRGKCIEAGANDYLAKPIDTDKLISLMRVWLYR